MYKLPIHIGSEWADRKGDPPCFEEWGKLESRRVVNIAVIGGVGYGEEGRGEGAGTLVCSGRGGGHCLRPTLSRLRLSRTDGGGVS